MGDDRDGQWRRPRAGPYPRTHHLLIARRPCDWVRSAQGSRGFPGKSLRAAPPWLCCSSLARCCGRCRSNHPHNPCAGRALQHGSSQRRRWPDNVAKDYAGIARNVPQLGPPSPSDLRHPAVTAEGQSGSIGLDAEQQRANQETEAARTSKVFASTTTSVTPSHTSSQETATKATSSSDETFTQNGQDSKLLFVNAPVDRRTTAPDRLSRPASPFVVQAGTIIPAALITGIRSDLPGQITAQVTEAIFDTPTGRAKLIPQGCATDRHLR